MDHAMSIQKKMKQYNSNLQVKEELRKKNMDIMDINTRNLIQNMSPIIRANNEEYIQVGSQATGSRILGGEYEPMINRMSTVEGDKTSMITSKYHSKGQINFDTGFEVVSMQNIEEHKKRSQRESENDTTEERKGDSIVNLTVFDINAINILRSKLNRTQNMISESPRMNGPVYINEGD